MAHLAAPRIGWENEHLATFLLSRISFVANPITVADDIGSDFLCTLFESRTGNNAEQLFPRNSFAIQIKSKEETIQATNKIQYLDKLELPFFVGVIDRDRDKLQLRIYSGEYVPILFPQYGAPRELRLSLVPAEEVKAKGYCQVKQDQNLVAVDALIRLPFVMEIGANEKRDDILKKGQELSKLCSRMHDNISARTSKEYIFKLGQPDSAMILAGHGSAQTFRYNFCLRLAEAFYNLEWIMKSPQRNLSMDEFRVYENCYLGLIEAKVEIPDMLRKIYEQLKTQLAGC